MWIKYHMLSAVILKVDTLEAALPNAMTRLHLPLQVLEELSL
jgi:hypothetical protein